MYFKTTAKKACKPFLKYDYISILRFDNYFDLFGISKVTYVSSFCKTKDVSIRRLINAAFKSITAIFVSFPAESVIRKRTL